MARWGGEEFLLLLTDTSLGLAQVGIDRMRNNLKTTLVSNAVPELKLTFSAGLTDYVEGESLATCLERADQALYQAKHRGRDCTIVSKYDEGTPLVETAQV